MHNQAQCVGLMEAKLDTTNAFQYTKKGNGSVYHMVFEVFVFLETSYQNLAHLRDKFSL